MIAVRVAPRSARDVIVGERDGFLVVRLTAPPLEGEANEALCRVLGKALHVPASSVSLLSGARGRRKRVHVRGAPGEIRARLGALCSPAG